LGGEAIHRDIWLTGFVDTDIIRTKFGCQQDIRMIFTLNALPADYVEVVSRIEALRAQLRYATSDSRRNWTGVLRRSTFARAIQGSNSIEGYHVTEDDAAAAVDEDEPMDEKTEAWFAVNGYRDAMTYILRLAEDPHFHHNQGTLNALHYMMVGFDVKANPGRWRRGAIWVKKEQTGETVYEGPEISLVPGLIAELMASLNEENNLPSVVRAAMAHLNLVMIHPFSDGNGRMSRALQSMVLARDGVLDPTFSSIEEYLGRYTADYYNVLAEVGQGHWNPERDALPWIKFCLTAHYRQAETLLRRTNDIERIWNRLETELKALRLNERMIFALADAAIGWRVRNSGYRKHIDVSDEVAGKDLRSLVEHGFLLPQGEKRGRVYIAGDRLKELREQTRSPVMPLNDPFVLAGGGQLKLDLT
jgi:Fic family protein